MHLNLAYRWFCRLDLADPVPNHSTFSKNRHGRFSGSDLLRHLFETTVARCIAEGLMSGQRFTVDANLIEDDANKQNSTAKEDWDCSAVAPEDAPRAARDYRDVLDDAAFGAASEVEPKFTSHSDPASQVARDIAKTEHYVISMRLRKRVEMLFAHLKRVLGLGRLRLRGPCGVWETLLLVFASLERTLGRCLSTRFPVYAYPSIAGTRPNIYSCGR